MSETKNEKKQPEEVEQPIEEAIEVEEGIEDFTPTPAKPLPTPKKEETEHLNTKEAQAEDLDLEDKKRVLMNISKAIYQKIKDEAYGRDTSRATIVREALDQYFTNKNNIIKQNPDKTMEIEKIQKAINESTDWFGNFDFEAFIINLQEQELVGDVWTEPLLEAYLIPKIHETSKGLLGLDQEALADNCNDYIEKLQLSEDNAKFIASKMGLKYGKVEQKEKGAFEGLI